MKIGYARVSTEDQRLDLQLTALKRAGCVKVFKDHGLSGSAMARPGLKRMLASLRSGQTLVVWRLDRLGRSLVGLVEIVDELGRRGIDFQSLTEEVNTASPGGRLVFHIMAALAEFERTLISERTKAGMAEAQRRGSHVGRPPILSEQQVAEAIRAVETELIKSIAARYGIHARTLQRQFRKVQGTDRTAQEAVPPRGIFVPGRLPPP